MAMKIPNAPEIVGTSPVLRQPDSINAKFESPNFKIDVSQPAQAIKDVGDAYASFVEQQTDTLMGAACNQFHHDVRQREEYYKNNYKGSMANDLYAKLEKDATGILDDITGDPKDDGKVRIANPELRKRFRDWASKQMPAYQARMTSYTATELDKANKLVLEDNLKRVNETIAEIDNVRTASAVIQASKVEYLRGAKLAAQGMPERYQVAQAARMLDEALLHKMDSMAKSNILSSLQFYYNVPEIQDSMSSTSEAAYFKAVEENYVSQGASRAADLMAAGLPMKEKGGFLDEVTMQMALPNKSAADKARIAAEIQKKGEEIFTAYKEAKRGQEELMYSSASTMMASTDISNPNQMMDTIDTLRIIDPRLADDFEASAQTQLSDDATINEFFDTYIYGDKELDEFGRRDTFEDNLASVLDKEQVDSLLNKSYQKAEARNDYEIDLLRRYREVQGRMNYWINNPAYQKAFEQAATGMYHGEYREELKDMPLALRQNIASVVEYNKRYNEITKMNPKLDGDLKSLVSKSERKKPTYMAMLKREVVKEFDRYAHNPAHGGTYPEKDSIEYNTILNECIKNAKSPAQMNVEKYLDEQAQDLLKKKGLDPELQPKKSIKYLRKKDILPEEVEYRFDISSSSEADDIADALINAYHGKKRRTLEAHRDSIIQTIERTGSADYWFMYADGISDTD